MNQVGCVYPTQCFEFYVDGVGPPPDAELQEDCDLRWDPATNDWIGDPGHSHDCIVKRSGDRFTDLVTRTYRVLLTRGLKGCYVVMQGDATQASLVSRTRPQ